VPVDPTWTIQPLVGHASNRLYFRVGAGPFRRIVMVAPVGQGSEEATHAEIVGEDPFVQVQRTLRRLGIRVPEIFGWDPEAGVMVLEDLGPVTLEDGLAQGDDPRLRRELLYGKAVDLLATLRARADREPDPGCPSSARSFDFDLYRWELDHYLEWGLGGRDGVQLQGEEAALFAAAAERICRRLDELPRGFTHRDYQSRNLMVLPGDELALIDFQDALQGPHVYDLVALLRDSYVDLPLEFVEGMLHRYLDRLREEGGPAFAADAFVADFHLLTVQRKLKDAGRFIFLDRVKGNASFLPYVTPSLGYVRAALERRPDLHDLWEVLRRHVPELA
jgi:aminoglycoside/choline kinase family phosphotransferase